MGVRAVALVVPGTDQEHVAHDDPAAAGAPAGLEHVGAGQVAARRGRPRRRGRAGIPASRSARRRRRSASRSAAGTATRRWSWAPRARRSRSPTGRRTRQSAGTGSSRSLLRAPTRSQLQRNRSAGCPGALSQPLPQPTGSRRPGPSGPAADQVKRVTSSRGASAPGRAAAHEQHRRRGGAGDLRAPARDPRAPSARTGRSPAGRPARWRRPLPRARARPPAARPRPRVLLNQQAGVAEQPAHARAVLALAGRAGA